MKVRTRIAPSPTGDFHVGHLRTVLYDYALSKKNGGEFILRIEDTDRTRYVEGSIERILSVLKDYGLSWDEGPEVGGPYEPYIQSQRLSLYKDYAQQLIDTGHAYYCFCSKERLDKLRKEQQKSKIPPKYDKHCLYMGKDELKSHLENGDSYVIRLNVPKDEFIAWHDEVYGDISIPTNDIDDQVLIKSDGFPTYHMAVVVDDHLMEITHILRGVDWLPSTPKHILLYKYFDWKVPIHIHLPNLKEKGSNKKLSKRSGAFAAIDFLKEGYLSEALLNFLMFLGWNPGTEKEIYTLDEFIQDFSVERVHKTDLVVFDRDKLLWMNGYYIRNTENELLLQKILTWKNKFNIKFSYDIESIDKTKLLSVIELVKEKLKTLAEFNEATTYFFTKPEIEKDMLIQYANDKTKEILSNFYTFLSEQSKWNASNLHDMSFEYIKKMGYKPKEAFMTIRVALSGKTATPQLFEILEVLKKEEVLKRLSSAQHIL